MLLSLLMLLILGCASGPRTRAPDWEDTTSTPAVVRPEPILAAPAFAVPEAQASSNIPAAQDHAVHSGSNASGVPKAANTPLAASEWTAPDGNNWVPVERWSRTTGLASVSRLTSAGSPAYVLRSAEGVFALHPGVLAAQWNGLEVRLGFAPQLIGEQPCVRALDLNKTLLPLLTARNASAFSGPIVVDPGHGGEDNGAHSVAGWHSEKDLALDWALRLKARLSTDGYRVFLTRSGDANIPLPDRVALAAAHHAGVFVSLHFNSAAPNLAEAGLETYCLTPEGMPSSLTRGYADELGQTFPNNSYDAQNLQLAVQVHRELLLVNGHQDRGVRRARFPAVLRGQQCPAVLIEGGYLSNPNEARLIAEPGYRQKLAEAVARGLEACLKPDT
jgi:N-acetylmuramoyl-L-alanine amidase